TIGSLDGILPGIMGMYNQKGRGRKSKLNPWQKPKVKEWVKSEPKSLNKVMAKKKWQIEVSKETIKRIIKKLNMKWKRMKRGMIQ
ncbi:MAG: helix-turn-helix domain-containing protein, partial [Microcoleaceae cyanobacterium]